MKNNAIMERMSDLKDRAYEKLFAKRIEQEKQTKMWKTLFIVTACILGVVVIGIVAYTVLKNKLDEGTIARIKARFSRDNDDTDFVEAGNEDVDVNIIEC